jgi:hypothetical protein
MQVVTLAVLREQVTSKANGFDVVAPKKNPAVSEVNAVNLAFQNDNYYVNDKLCPTYSEALENQAYKMEYLTSKADLDHITEAGGYCVFKTYLVEFHKYYNMKRK